MTTPPFEVLASGFQFCEAPRVAEDGTAYFSDLTGGGYHRVRDGTIRTVLPDRRWIGGATFDAGEAMLLTGEGGIVLAQDGTATPLLEAIDGTPIGAVNDIEADASGAIYGGTIDFDAILIRGEPPSPGLFFHLAPGAAPVVLREGLVGSNGIGFSPDGRTLYHAESGAGIWAWGMRDGAAAGPPALFAKADDCDGLAVDAEGGVWCAFFEAACLRRYRADATIDREIALPFASVVSLTFHGSDLYVTTGGDAARPGTGGLIRLRTDVPGLPTHRSAFGQG